jgi:hypothetical protein
VAGWPAADSLNLLVWWEGAGMTLLQLCMLEVWYQDDLVDMKAMSMATCTVYIDNQSVSEQTVL